ncbi:hypothetical protein LOD99_3691 [Oopsacas minuta]|uniref:Uncharacterized protein n=1 Tax=Oopsacas minuta TaxID=111878 RepID=A0AAV7JXH5_9METZ|nr:hypothetical protein LOD99_3691 [Oopsacas minuta]
MVTNMSQLTQLIDDQMLQLCEKRLREIQSFDLEAVNPSERDFIEFIKGFEMEMAFLDKEETSILSMETRSNLKYRYSMIIEDYKNIITIPNLLVEMDQIIAPFEVKVKMIVRISLSKIYEEFEMKMSTNKMIPVSLKSSFNNRYNLHLQKATQLLIDDILPIDFKDSLYYIERTLAEPSLYSLNGLIMWKETADKKMWLIRRLFLMRPEFPKQIGDIIVKRYESLSIKLKAEILKMRTYPIPEPWCSDCVKNGLRHAIDGEFIFYLDPDIEEGMKPVNPSKRDILPGGISRQEYDTRMNRLDMEYAIARDTLESMNADDIEKKCTEIEDWYTKIEGIVSFTFNELSLLYRDARSLEFLVRKNIDDKLLRTIYDIVLRTIRHYFHNRIDIPSFAITIYSNPLMIAPPKEERNIPVESGVDRGGEKFIQLDTPAAVIVVKNNIIVADRYGDSVSLYRADDLAATFSYHNPRLAGTPVSLTYFKPFVFVCYSSLLVQYCITWEDSRNAFEILRENNIKIPQACCIASSEELLYVGTLKPSLIHIQLDPLRVEHEYPLNPILHTMKRNRYPWLQDMKVAGDFVFCLFTGSPYPLQWFSLEGELIKLLLTEDQIVGAYNFNVFWNPITDEWRFYVCDFWDNSIKVFDMFGNFIETICETGHGLCQIFRPTCIFIEITGYTTIGDMKVDNCLQRF